MHAESSQNALKILFSLSQIKAELLNMWSSINSTRQWCSDIRSSQDTLSVKVRNSRKHVLLRLKKSSSVTLHITEHYNCIITLQNKMLLLIYIVYTQLLNEFVYSQNFSETETNVKVSFTFFK